MGRSCLPSWSGYASHAFSALPNVSVYIDAGASDWLRNDPAKALKILVPAGIDTARGFALNSTHYASTSAEIAFGTAVVQALAAAGYADKHFVVNTASNGAPFNGYDYHGPNFDNAATCKTKGQQALRHARYPADRGRRQPGLGPLGDRRGQRGGVRRRLPVDRPALAVHAGRPVRPQAGPRGRQDHALLISPARPPVGGVAAASRAAVRSRPQ